MSYIVPSEKPRTCGVCPFARLSQINYGKCWCALDSTHTRSYANSYEKLDNCPLVEISTPHGRLIDAAFEENHYASMLLDPTPDVTEQDKHKARIVIDALRMAKTVIEAEGSET